jgi:hypothetical protein
MRTALRPRRAPAAAALIGAVLLMLTFSQVALGVFTHAVSAGPLTVASATMTAPSKLASSQLTCKSGKAPEVQVSWSAGSEFATSYSVERATASAGPYTVLGSVTSEHLSYIDSSSPGYSTTYYYRASAVYRSWSKASTYTSVKTLSKFCT